MPFHDVPLTRTQAEIAARASSRALKRCLADARAGRRTLVMGVLNVTPDSFSDGGLFVEPDAALERAIRMSDEGADLIDVGGESTRPSTFTSSTPLPAEEELRRILPVISAISARLPNLPISVDTYKASAARAAVEAGAVMVNDISALRADPEMAKTVADLGVPVCLMHMPGLPTEIQTNARYENVVNEVAAHLRERANAANAAGIDWDSIIVDPGIGFGKSAVENLELLRFLRVIVGGGPPVLVGTSRKSTIGSVLGGLPSDQRIEGTAATVAIAIANGAAIVRVHDVLEMARVVKMSDAIVRGWRPAESEVEGS